jgi:phosphate transport system protein
MKYPEHTSAQFDAELTAVRESVQKMGATVERQLRSALDALATGDLMTIERVLDDGHTVNAMEVEIDEKCTDILVRRQPTANDLRLVTMVIKTINDLERIGDEAENIARMSKSVAQKQPYHFPCYLQMKYIGETALEILRAALDAFDALDVDAAKKAWRKDALIDDEFRIILRHLVAYMMEDTSALSTTLQAALVARALERIGDHAKHISEYVVYMVEGRESRNY